MIAGVTTLIPSQHERGPESFKVNREKEQCLYLLLMEYLSAKDQMTLSGYVNFLI